MDPAGGFVLFILVVLAILIVWACCSNKDETKSSDDPPKIISDDLSKKTTPNVVEKKANAPSYVTVYQHQATRKVKVCPHCDGENAQTADICEICGDKI